MSEIRSVSTDSTISECYRYLFGASFQLPELRSGPVNPKHGPLTTTHALSTESSEEPSSKVIWTSSCELPVNATHRWSWILYSFLGVWLFLFRRSLPVFWVSVQWFIKRYFSVRNQVRLHEVLLRLQKVVVLDIEGTTTPISCVTEVLFPYARDNVGSFLRSTYDTTETRTDIQLLRDQVSWQDSAHWHMIHFNSNCVDNFLALRLSIWQIIFYFIAGAWGLNERSTRS